MTITTSSSINYLNINENFPIAGQDNDTQVFRDNFDTIKTSLRNAKTEIDEILGAAARKDDDNDFNLNIIQNAVMQNNREQKFDKGLVTASPTTVDYQNGSYQIMKLGANVTVDFLNFPGGPELTTEPTPVGVGKVTLELYGDGSPRILTFSTSGGTVIKKDSSFPGSLTLTSASNPVFIEVWRHSEAVIFMRYLGQFS